MGALAYLGGNPGQFSERQTVLAAWALDNPDLAIDWALENFETQGGGGHPWLVEMIRGFASTDLDRATSLLNRLPESLEQRDALNSIMGTLSEKDVDATIEWVAELTDGRVRAAAARRVGMRLADTDPKKAARFAETLDAESRRQLFEELTQPWALTAPEEALAWASTLSGDSLHQVAEKIGPAVAAKDPQLASQWLAQFDRDPAFDNARRRLAMHLSRDNPELAAGWITRITDSAMGEKEYHVLLGEWMVRDADGAVRYLGNNPAPESVKLRAERILREQEASHE